MAYTTAMGSMNVQRFAGKLAEKVGSGKLVNLGEIARDSGYSDMTAKTPTKITRTKTYRALAKPLLDGLDEQIKILQQSIRDTDLTQEDLRSKTYAYDILVKNRQLLSGGATERQVFVMPSEVLTRNNITVTEVAKAMPDKGNNGSTRP